MQILRAVFQSLHTALTGMNGFWVIVTFCTIMKWSKTPVLYCYMFWGSKYALLCIYTLAHSHHAEWMCTPQNKGYEDGFEGPPGETWWILKKQRGGNWRNDGKIATDLYWQGSKHTHNNIQDTNFPKHASLRWVSAEHLIYTHIWTSLQYFYVLQITCRFCR